MFGEPPPSDTGFLFRVCDLELLGMPVSTLQVSGSPSRPVSFGKLQPGSKVVLQYHKPIQGDTCSTEGLDKVAGCPAVLIKFVGSCPTGVPLVVVRLHVEGKDTEFHIHLQDLVLILPYSPAPSSIVARSQRFKVTLIAGTESSGHKDGSAGQAEFSGPRYCAVDPLDGGIFISDTNNHVIRKILPDSTVKTVAGSPKQGGFQDGVGAAAKFNRPFGIAFERNSGMLYVAEYFSDRIRAVGRDGKVTTVAGTGQQGSADGPASTATFNKPFALCVCPRTGNIFVSEEGSNKIRCIALPQQGAEGVATVTTVAGSGVYGFEDGPALQAQFKGIWGLAVCQVTGNIVVGDQGNNRVRVVTPQGEVKTMAGSGREGSEDGLGAAASFNRPAGVAVDSAGNVFVLDSGNSQLRKVTHQGVVTTLRRDVAGAPVKLHDPLGLALSDSLGSSLITVEWTKHTVSRVSPV
jgi:sugar lactone lactonase YvrE